VLLVSSDLRAVGFALLAVAFMVDTPSAAAGASCPWTLVPGPPSNAVLQSVSAVSRTDAWIAGYRTVGVDARSLTLHWDGSSWSAVPSPNIATETALEDVLALGRNDVWAVGEYETTNPFVWHTLALHWAGAGWAIVPTVDATAGVGGLKALGGTGPNDIWAAGNPTQHWDGHSWQVSPTGIDPSGYLTSVKAFATNDAWIVGDWLADDHADHWDGTQWSFVPVPEVPGTPDLEGADGVAPDDLWAVGSEVIDYDKSGTLALHWDGLAWSAYPTPNPRQVNSLVAAAAVSSEDVWAVGFIQLSKLALVEHWDGSAWSVVRSRRPGRTSELRDVTTIPGGGLWAVGTGDSGSLIEHHC
jgi:hypothetical protein